MIFGMLLTEETGQIIFVRTFKTEPLRRLSAHLARRFRLGVAHQQRDRVLSQRRSLVRTDDQNFGFGCGAEIVEVGEFRYGLEDSIRIARGRNFLSLPTAGGELARVIAALQPDCP